MKNKKSILIVIVVLILLLIIFFVWKSTNKKTAGSSLTTQEQQQTTQKPSGETASTVSGNIFDLIKLGKSLRCTYSTAMQDLTITGTTYVSGKNMRGHDENTEPDGTKVQSHMISDGEWVYSWTSASPQGIKMSITKAQSQSSAPATTGTTSDQNQNTFNNNVDFKCIPWVEDASVFQVPTDIKFMDFSAPAATSGSGNNSVVCSACEQIQNATAKAACQKQLGCQ